MRYCRSCAPGVMALCPPQQIIAEIMKKIIKQLIILTAFFCILCPEDIAFGESLCGHVTVEWISGHIPLPENARLVQTKERLSLCEAVLFIDGSLVPVYAGKEFVMAGQLFNNGRSITRETVTNMTAKVEKEKINREQIPSFFRKNLTVLEELTSITFPSGTSDKFIYVMTDPNCSHCKEMLPKIKRIASEANIQVKMIIYPVLGSLSMNMASHAICNDISFDEYSRMPQDVKETYCERAQKRLRKTRRILESAGVTFVPVFIAGDGSWVVDSNDINQVRTHLGMASEKGAYNPGSVCNSVQK